jgi:hypothetical protein
MRTVTIIAGLLALTGCAGRGAVQDGSHIEHTIGSTSFHELTETGTRILMANAFQIDRFEREPRVLIETHWRDRRPFDDEIAVGIEHAQTRLVITGSRRSATPLGPLYSVRMAVHNRVQVAGADDWRYVAATPQYRNWVEQISGTLRRELTMGIRVF